MDDAREPAPQGRPVMGRRLLGIEDVVSITGLCARVASQVIDETGRPIVLHGRKYVFEDDFDAYLRSLGGGDPR